MFEDEIGRLTGSLDEATPRKDRYLVELAAVTVERTIVTTDERLKDAVDGKEGIRILLLDEFLGSYALGDVGSMRGRMQR